MTAATITVERPAAAAAGLEDLDARRALAFDANFELECLARTAKKLLDEERREDTVRYTGILSRIETLTQIIFFAMRLHGSEDPDHDWGDKDDLETLRRVFEGMLA